MYPQGRPTDRARRLNARWARLARTGLTGDRMVTLEVVGRRSGRPIDVPLLPAKVGGQLYLGAMLGPQVNWVRNVEASGGRARLHHGRRHDDVVLHLVPEAERAPLVKAFLQASPGARAFHDVDPDGPVESFEPYLARIPVFRVEIV